MPYPSISFAIPCCALLLAFGGAVFAERVDSEPQIMPTATGLTIPAGPFLISVFQQKDGKLTVAPDWALLADPSDFDAMAQPILVRTVSENGWKIGEFALSDGTWSPLFVAPDADASEGSNSSPEISIPGPDATGAAVSIMEVATINASVAELISDPLAIGTADPTFPASVSAAYLQSVIDRPLPAGARRFFVNNVSGSDLAEGKMLHPQTGKHATKGPLKTLAAVLRQIRSGDEIVLIGTLEAYPANFTIPNVTDIIITPVGDVILKP